MSFTTLRGFQRVNGGTTIFTPFVNWFIDNDTGSLDWSIS